MDIKIIQVTANNTKLDLANSARAPWNLNLPGIALYGPAWPGDVHLSEPCMVEVKFETNDGTRYQLQRELRPDGLGQETLERCDKEPLSTGVNSFEDLVGIPAEAFMRQSLLQERVFASMFQTHGSERTALFDKLIGPALMGEVSSLSCRRYKGRLAKTDALPEKAQDPDAARLELARVLDEIGGMEQVLNRRADEMHRIDDLKRSEMDIRDLDRRRGDLERNRAIFAPLQQRLERGRAALELCEVYEALKDLRRRDEQCRLEQLTLRDNLTTARAESRNAEEAFTLLEGELREKLVAQAKLNETARTVEDLDRQFQERQAAVLELQERLKSVQQSWKETGARVDKDQISSERTELALREAKKYLQTHAIDERLSVGLAAIKKCFELYKDATEKRALLKEQYSAALRKRQQAQNALNDRQAMFSDISHRFVTLEKNHERAQSFFEFSLKGKTLAEWREICEQTRTRIENLNELEKKFTEERELRDRLKALQDARLKMQEETRGLNMRSVEQTGQMQELQGEVERLEKRVALLRRVEDLAPLRELLQDLEGQVCPLCGSTSHPWVAGVALPNPEEAENQLHEATRALNKLKDEFTSRETRTGQLATDITGSEREEGEIQRKLNNLADLITNAVFNLGLKIGPGVPALEELEQARQRSRDQLSRAQMTLDAAEAAERELQAATDELARVRESRAEITKYNQEALFQLQNTKADVEKLENESRSQEESWNGLRRELVAQFSPYGYKSVPDENPEAIVATLNQRSADWQEKQRQREELERTSFSEQGALVALRKERNDLKLRTESLSSSLKAAEAERDSIHQQRIVLFAAKNPQTERERMNREVKELHEQLEIRRKAKGETAVRVQEILTALHDRETETSTRRGQLQKDEIAFGKKLLASGFKNEDDYLSAQLTDDERRELQAKLKDITREDLDLAASRENARALQMARQARETESRVTIGDRVTFLKKLLDLNRKAGELYLSLADDPEARRIYTDFANGLKPRLRDLRLGGGDESFHAQMQELVFDAVLDLANARLAANASDAGGASAKSTGQISHGDKPLSFNTSGSVTTGEACTALAWGLSDLFCATGKSGIRVLEPDRPDAALEKAADRLRRPDESLLLRTSGGMASHEE